MLELVAGIQAGIASILTLTPYRLLTMPGAGERNRPFLRLSTDKPDVQSETLVIEPHIVNK